MLLFDAIAASDFHAAIYPNSKRYKTVVSQYGPFTFPDNFIDHRYCIEIHCYEDDELESLVKSFKPISRKELLIRLGVFAEDDNWQPYNDMQIIIRTKKKVESVEDKINRLYKRLYGDTL